MQCDKVRDILITDYIDYELDQDSRKEIEGHLIQCPECLAFKDELINNVKMPFKGKLEAAPPGFIWDKIRTAIEKDGLNAGIVNIGEMLSFFRPQWINVSVISLMVCLTLLVGNYFARDIWSSAQQKRSQASIEVSDNLGLGIFGDIPGEETENASNIIGG
ncbi:MAG: zf-HC2 domain-containing protein [Elusimicrobia bacterium]|nr:zf-HC2 domain-containing protein [Candidatus Liberimonas magnetica]